MSALASVHRAFWDRLNASTALLTAGFEIWDEPPAKPQGSYIVIGESPTEARSPAADTHDLRAYEVTETLHIWLRENSSRRAAEVLGLVRDELEDQELPIPDHVTLFVRLEFAQILREPGWRHIAATFRVVVQSPIPVR